MFGFENIAIDRLSFWLGFIAGGLFFILVSRFIKAWPLAQNFINHHLTKTREQRLSGIDLALRKEVLQLAQRNHIAADLFSLNEILIQPFLLAPPPLIDPEDPPQFDHLSSLVITYLPECPEFAARFAPIRLTLPQALQGNAKIVVIGRSGCGKSTALAALASSIARMDVDLGVLSNSFPVYLHILDIQFDFSSGRNPMDALVTAISRQAPVTVKPQLSNFLNHAFQDGNPILLLDGVDELPPQQLVAATQWLKMITNEIPSLRVITTGSPDYIDGLTSIGFEPLAIAGWTTTQIREFVERWGKLWNSHLAPNINQQISVGVLDDLLVTNWICQDVQFLTPLEWTLKVWASYAGDLPGSASLDLLRSYWYRSAENLIPEAALASLAQEMIRQKIAVMDYSKAGTLLSSFTLPPEDQRVESKAGLESNIPNSDKPQGLFRRKTNTSGNPALDQLIKTRMVTEHTHSMVAFSNPAWTGFFAALQPFEAKDSGPPPRLWAPQAEYYRFDLTHPTTEWLDAYLFTDTPPIYRNLQNTAIWMRDTPSNHPNRTRIMRQVVQHLQNEAVPYEVRMRLLAACSTSNDPALLLLFRQLIASSSYTVRSLAALGLGINQDIRSIKEIGQLFSDENQPVRHSACLALSAIESTEARSVITDALLYGDETLRLLAAEVLAAQPGPGHQQLIELVKSEDLLIRRSAVYGISKISEPWVISILEKIAVEESQWVVRNTVGQALENLQRPNPYIPRPLPAPADTPWLIGFAARLGLGVSKTDSPIPILLQVIKAGSHDEQLAAITLLRYYNDDHVISELYNLLQTNRTEIRAAILYTLWHMGISGRLITEQRDFVFTK